MSGAWLIWCGLMWIAGVALHIGYKDNPSQPKIKVGRLVTKLMTLGAVQGEVALVPTLFQLSNLLLLLGVMVEYHMAGLGLPLWSIRGWLIAVLACGTLSRIVSKNA